MTHVRTTRRRLTDLEAVFLAVDFAGNNSAQPDERYPRRGWRGRATAGGRALTRLWERLTAA